AMKKHFRRRAFWLFLIAVGALIWLLVAKLQEHGAVGVPDMIIGAVFILIGGISAWKGARLLSWNGFLSFALTAIGVYIEIYYFGPAVRGKRKRSGSSSSLSGPAARSSARSGCGPRPVNTPRAPSPGRWST